MIRSVSLSLKKNFSKDHFRRIVRKWIIWLWVIFDLICVTRLLLLIPRRLYINHGEFFIFNFLNLFSLTIILFNNLLLKVVHFCDEKQPIDSFDQEANWARRTDSCDGIISDCPWVLEALEESLDLTWLELRGARVVRREEFDQVEDYMLGICSWDSFEALWEIDLFDDGYTLQEI